MGGGQGCAASHGSRRGDCHEGICEVRGEAEGSEGSRGSSWHGWKRLAGHGGGLERSDGNLVWHTRPCIYYSYSTMVVTYTLRSKCKSFGDSSTLVWRLQGGI